MVKTSSKNEKKQMGAQDKKAASGMKKAQPAKPQSTSKSAQKPKKEKAPLKKFTQAQQKRTKEVEKHLSGKKTKLSKKEVDSQIAFRESIQDKIETHDAKIKKLNTDKCLTLLINCMEVIKKQLEKNPTPTNKADREKVILSLIKINLVDKHFKDRQKVKEEKEYVKAARVQIKDFFKVLNTIK